MSDGQQWDIFISYSHGDKKWVRDWLLPRLENANLKACIDYRDFEIGVPALVNMERAAKQSRHTLFVMSPKWTLSEWTDFESLLVQTRDPAGRRKRMLPLMLKACDLPDRLGILTWADFRKPANRDGELARLLKQIDKTKPAPARPDDTGPRISTGRLPHTEGEDLFGREGELARLDAAWKDPKTHVLSLVAFGGVGKTALVKHWMGRMAAEDWRGATAVFDWSFYSQGSKNQQASGDPFITAALAFLGDPDPTVGSPWDKGERLAALAARDKVLLVLDGLEPLQEPPLPGLAGGRLRDPAVARLLACLAGRNGGLCLVTTRQSIDDLSPYRRGTAPEADLENLDPGPGARLLESLGVKGTDAELRQAVAAMKGHALALTLAGGYLRDAWGGDIRHLGEVKLAEADAEQGGHARRAMAAYEAWLGPVEGAILRLVGLFDRPAEGRLVKELRRSPALPGLTEPLMGLGPAQWNIALSRLRKARLLAAADQEDPEGLDAHPLVREYFGGRLKAENPEDWRAAHGRLYEFLRDNTEEFPEDERGLRPLFQAVAHGCAAGRHQDASDEVFYGRIRRQGEHFSVNKLGLFGSDLAALASFFAVPWREPAAGLSDGDKAFVLNEAGFGLRALGRLAEAAEPLAAGLEMRIARESWANAARTAGNLSDLQGTLGALAEAEATARRGVELADKSEDGFLREALRTDLAAALHRAGDRDGAAALFVEAEALQRERKPQEPYLHSLPGYRYCDLLLERGEVAAVRERASFSSGVVTWLLNLALDTLTLGRADWVAFALRCAPRPLGVMPGLAPSPRPSPPLSGGEGATAAPPLFPLHPLAGGEGWVTGAVEPGPAPTAEEKSLLASARRHLDAAVDGLRRAGQQDYLCTGLLARAAWGRVAGEGEAARRDLDEVRLIAERGGMKIHLTNLALEEARLALAQGDREAARPFAAEARRLIAETGYHRRDGELAEIEAALG